MAAWLAEGFETPQRVDLPTGHHLRPIRESDVEIDYPAVMAAREKLWAKYGAAWGWPPADMTYEQDREDLKHHEDEIAAQITFNYALLNDDESELLGCVYVDPPADAGHDAVASWWSTDEQLERMLDEFVPSWLRETWGFRAVDYSP